MPRFKGTQTYYDVKHSFCWHCIMFSNDNTCMVIWHHKWQMCVDWIVARVKTWKKFQGCFWKLIKNKSFFQKKWIMNNFLVKFWKITNITRFEASLHFCFKNLCDITMVPNFSKNSVPSAFSRDICWTFIDFQTKRGDKISWNHKGKQIMAMQGILINVLFITFFVFGFWSFLAIKL